MHWPREYVEISQHCRFLATLCSLAARLFVIIELAPNPAHSVATIACPRHRLDFSVICFYQARAPSYAGFAETTPMWRYANNLLERTERFTLNEWMLIGACALFFSVVYLLTKQR
jgi:hypothetical protein